MNFLRRTGSINLILWLAWVLSAEAFLDKSHHPIKKDRQKSSKQKTTGFVLAQIQPVSWDHQAVSHHIMFFILLHQISFPMTSAVGSLKFHNEGHIIFWARKRFLIEKSKEVKKEKKSRGEGTPLHGVTPWQQRRDLMSQASTRGSLPFNILCTPRILNRHLMNRIGPPTSSPTSHT